MTLYRQTFLSQGNTMTVAWLDQDKPYKEGDLVRLKGDNTYWKVELICQKTLTRSEINREWKAGGL